MNRLRTWALLPSLCGNLHGLGGTTLIGCISGRICNRFGGDGQNTTRGVGKVNLPAFANFSHPLS